MESFLCVALYQKTCVFPTLYQTFSIFVVFCVFSIHRIQDVGIIFLSLFYSCISIIMRSKEALIVTKKCCGDFFSSLCKRKKLHNPYIYADVFSLLHPHIYGSLSSISLTHLRFRSSTPHGNVLYRNFANFYSYTRYPIILSLLEYNV